MLSGTKSSSAKEVNLKYNFKTEQGISECYLEGVLRHSGSISGYIYIVTQLVKNSEGDGRLFMVDVDEALSRLLGELSATSRELNSMNRFYWLDEQPNVVIPPPIEEVIAQAAENLADPNFFIAEVSGILSALVELKEVCHQRREGAIED